MNKHKLFLLPVVLLLAFMAFACAPPDDNDDNGAPSSGPTINNAIYDFATALLTIQGTNLSPTEAQIQTIVVDGVALSSYAADDDATGVNSNGLEQGKYRIKSDGTALWLKLTDPHKATLEAKVGSNGLKKGLLSVSSGSWAGLNTAKDLDVRNIPDKQTETEEESPKLPEAEQTEEVDDQSPKQPKDKQVEQAEEESPKQTEDKQSKIEAEDQSPKQPKDKQVEQAEEESPEAAITRASYHVGTALLTVQGTDLGSATQAQIQTIVVDGVALSSYTADGTATGPDSRGLAKGKYRLHSAGTALWLKLTDPHKATLNGKPGMDSNGLKDGLLTSTGTWTGLDTAKGLAVSGNPAITRATYNVGMALLTVQGTDLGSATQAQIQTIVVDGVALDSYIADATDTGPDSRGLAKGKYRIKSDGTALWLYLTDPHKATLNGKPGMDSNGLKDGLLTSTGAWAGLDTAKALAVSGNPAPAITRATYNSGTGVLVITGVNLPKSVTGWDFTKLRFVAGNGRKSEPLLRHRTTSHTNAATGSAASATSLTITLKGSEYTKARNILVKNGESDDTGAYNLEAAAGFAGGSAEDTTNPITVSGYVVKIDSVRYFANTGDLFIQGTNLPTKIAEWDFSKLTLVSGDGSKRYKLPQHATGENTATGSSSSRISLHITLSGSVKAEVDKILVKNGESDDAGAYNLEVAAGFVIGGSADPTTKIKVSDVGK